MQERETIYLTPEGKQKLQEELAHLEGPKRDKLAQRLRAAIEMGDLSENADYISAKEEQGFLEGRIQEIKHILHNATIVEEKENGHSSVMVGARVTVQEEDDSPETYHLVGSQEADPINGKISHASPIGQALLGKKKGDQVIAQTPNGQIKLTILDIE
jgi:transcription elongation factor GreA